MQKSLIGRSLSYDFYLPKYNLLVEFQGQQHEKPIDFEGSGEENARQRFEKQQEHDRRKNSYCLANNISLYRIPYWEIKNLKAPTDIFSDKFLVKTRWHNDYLEVPHKSH